MAVDKNLFLYDLAIVAIMKNESLYVKEWLDYHLLAGANHFYIYDNESTDNLKEVLQPYIDKVIVTYTFFPGKARQYEAYNNAVQNYRFFCKYMAFIDADEFIFPQSNKSVVEVLDEILTNKSDVTGLAINWHQFGSNNLEKADYSRGVLERFTGRLSDSNVPIIPGTNLPGGNAMVKIIANPRKLDYFWNPHFAVFFDGLHPVNENGETVTSFFNNPTTVEKIVLNHYGQKSREEYEKKVARGAADHVYNIYQKYPFQHIYNDEFDDGILKYRNARKKFLESKNFPLESDSEIQNRIISALNENLLSVSPNNIPENFLDDKVENFLICLAMSEKFQNMSQDIPFVKYALFWLYQALRKKCSVEDWLLLFSALPDILKIQNSVTEKIRAFCLEMIPHVISYLRTYVKKDCTNYNWQKIAELMYLSKMLKTFDVYR